MEDYQSVGRRRRRDVAWEEDGTFTEVETTLFVQLPPAKFHPVHTGGEWAGRAGQGRAGQGRAGQGRAGQGRAGQGRAGRRTREGIWQGRCCFSGTKTGTCTMSCFSLWSYRPKHIRNVCSIPQQTLAKLAPSLDLGQSTPTTAAGPRLRKSADAT